MKVNRVLDVMIVVTNILLCLLFLGRRKVEQKQLTEYEKLQTWAEQQERRDEMQDHLIDQLIYDMSALGVHDKKEK